MELCNSCNQYSPSSEINFAGYCSACQQSGEEKQLTEIEQVTQSVCGRGITFYASDTCAYCENYSGYGNPLCETCWEKEDRCREAI